MSTTGNPGVIDGAELGHQQPRGTDMADQQHASNQQANTQAQHRPTADCEPVMLSAQAALPADRLVDLVRWRRWYQSARGVKRMRSWSDRHRALSGWHNTSAFEAPVSSSATDAMQAALVSLTQSGDAEAAVALLVQLRPGLVRLVRQLDATQSLARSDGVEEVRAVFFEVLVGHSLERRPSRIAANLLLDTRQRLHRGFRKTHGPLQLVVTPSLHSWPDVDDYTPILAYETLRAAASSLPGSPASQRLTADLGFRAWVLGQPRSDIARELALGPETVRSRLHRFRSAIRSDYDLQFEYGRSA